MLHENAPMTALLQTPLPTRSAEKRITPRTRIAGTIRVQVGRGEGVLVDLGRNGARLRHCEQVQRGSNLRLSFDWAGEGFASTAEVLASRVVVLRDGNGRTQYETRLRFRLLTEAARTLLHRVVAALENEGVRIWMSSLRGGSDRSLSDLFAEIRRGSYVRCEFLVDRWETAWTADPRQPEHGFVLPAGVDRHVIAGLCSTYEHLDHDGRHLVRLVAAEALT